MRCAWKALLVAACLHRPGRLHSLETVLEKVWAEESGAAEVAGGSGGEHSQSKSLPWSCAVQMQAAMQATFWWVYASLRLVQYRTKAPDSRAGGGAPEMGSRSSTLATCGFGFKPHWRPQPAKLPSFGGYSLETLPYLTLSNALQVQRPPGAGSGKRGLAEWQYARMLM